MLRSDLDGILVLGFLLMVAVITLVVWYTFKTSRDPLQRTKSFRIGIITLLTGILMFVLFDIGGGIGCILTGISVIFLRDGISHKE